MCQSMDRGMWWNIMHNVFYLARLWITRRATFWLHVTSRRRKENSTPFSEHLRSFPAFKRTSDTLFLFCVTFWKALRFHRPQRYFQANAKAKLFLSSQPYIAKGDFFFFLFFYLHSAMTIIKGTFEHAHFETNPLFSSCQWGQLTISKGRELLKSLVSQDSGFWRFKKAKEGGININLFLPNSICDMKLHRAMQAPSCFRSTFSSHNLL